MSSPALQDAYFISRVGLGGVGVADGVSGWADEGIDPAEYPRLVRRALTRGARVDLHTPTRHMASGGLAGAGALAGMGAA